MFRTLLRRRRRLGATALALAAFPLSAHAAPTPAPAEFIEEVCLDASSGTSGWWCGGTPTGMVTGTSPLLAESISASDTWDTDGYPSTLDTYSGVGSAASFGGSRPGASVTASLEGDPHVPNTAYYLNTGYGMARVFGEVSYEIIAVNEAGSSVDQVPLVIDASGSAAPGTLSGRVGADGWGRSRAHLEIRYPAASGTQVFEAEAFALVQQGGGSIPGIPTLDSFAVHEVLPLHVPIAPGSSAKVEIALDVEAVIRGEIYVSVFDGVPTVEVGNGSVSGSVDPAIYVDPSWPHASSYRLDFSAGIEPAPEPLATAPIAAAALAFLAWRNRSAARVDRAGP